MPLTIVNPSSFENPDSGQVGSVAVTTPSVTGHAGTSASVIGSAGLQIKACRWFGFPNVGGRRESVTLKMDHTSSGALAGLSKTNAFRLQYSLDNGSNWITAVSRADFTASQGPTTFSVALAADQDLTQVQVRDTLTANTLPDGGNATATATIANILMEVTTFNAGPIIVL